MNETKTLPPKHYVVHDEETGRNHFAVASTIKGAISATHAHLKSKLSARLATSSELLQAGKDGTKIIDGSEEPNDDQQPLPI